MAKQLGKFSFPDTYPLIVKNTLLGPVFREYIAGSIKNIQNMDYFIRLPKAERKNIDKLFFYENASYSLPAPKNDLDLARALEMMQSTADGRQKSWQLFHKKMSTRYIDVFNTKIIPDFFRSDSFNRFFDAEVQREAEMALGYYRTEYKFKSLNEFKDLLGATLRTDIDLMKTTAIKFLKKEGIVAQPVDFAMRVLKKQPLLEILPPPPPIEDLIKIDKAKLKKACFEKYEDRKLEKAVMTLCRGLLQKEEGDINSALKEIKRIEPKDSFWSVNSIKTMQLMLTKAKIISAD